MYIVQMLVLNEYHMTIILLAILETITNCDMFNKTHLGILAVLMLKHVL